MEKRNCQNCKKDFVVEGEDFNFYEKIKVPPPTWCPPCRMIRRSIWRNTRSLYKRECNLCKKSLISMYKDDGSLVCCTECLNGLYYDAFQYGLTYDFKQTFFQQVMNLWKKVPRHYAYHTGNIINSEYTNYSADNKNAYLSFSVIGCEDVMYSDTIDYSKNSLDCYTVQKVNNCSYNVDCENNFNVHYAVKSKDCLDSYFIFDCVNCSNCYSSSNLRNQKYFFKNKKLSKEDYFTTLAQYELNKHSVLEKNIEEFDNLIKNDSIHRSVQVFNSVNVVGNYISNSKNIFNSFNIKKSENIRYSCRVLDSKDSYDHQGLADGELNYETVAASFGTFKDFFCYITLNSRECEYSGLLKNCSNCFGCFGLINAQYCILNKQYSKEEYADMVQKIKKHMNDLPYVDNMNRIYKYGEFFPIEMSPFYINETVCIDYFRFREEESKKYNFPWKEKEKRDYPTTIKSIDLKDNINDVNEDILKEIIECPGGGRSDYQCSTAFRIVQNELSFYKEKKLPLPRYCPNCRHYRRLKYLNPFKLWHRKCMKPGCANEFETSYAPERPEIVYCEKCYQQEVY